MKVVHHFAGLVLDESDVLRRIMSGKKHNGDTLERLRGKFFAEAQVRGHDPEVAKEVWRQVESFAGYSFCKAHSASFAVESFQSLYLKAYYPLEFIVGVINNFGGFYRTEFYVHEARLGGAVIHPPCINHSLYLTDLQGKDLYLGFIHIKGISEQLMLRVLLERNRRGPFASLTDFCTRVRAESFQLDLLIRIGAFRFTGKTKAELLWEKNAVFNPRVKEEPALELFAVTAPPQHFALDFSPNHRPGHSLSVEEIDQAFDELELLGFMLCSPFVMVKGGKSEQPVVDQDQPRISSWSIAPHKRLATVRDRDEITLLAYFVCDKVVPTVKGERMSFGCWLDEGGRYFDTVHFPDSLRAYPFRGAGVYRLHGRVTREFDFPTLEVWRMERLAYLDDRRFGG